MVLESCQGSSLRLDSKVHAQNLWGIPPNTKESCLFAFSVNAIGSLPMTRSICGFSYKIAFQHFPHYRLVALWEVRPFLHKTGFCIFLFTFGKERSAITAECRRGSKSHFGSGSSYPSRACCGAVLLHWCIWQLCAGLQRASTQGWCCLWTGRSGHAIPLSCSGLSISHTHCERGEEKWTGIHAISFGQSHFNICKATKNSSITK